ncbi:MAG TPA: flagellar biosynthesis protein FlgH [Verrucomicrobiales bacterium]|nr:flagellar biosynthesis protein FlgH [Verrucomicrobiales bacterium]
MTRPFSSSFKFVLLVSATAAGLLSATADSLVKPNAKSMFADKKGVAVGDIITIIVQESTSSSKDNSTSTSKKSALDAQLETFFYSPAASGLLTKGGQLPALKFNSGSSFDGGGSMQNSEKITARVAVQVIDALPNQTLLIEGRKQTKINGETSDVILRGVVRVQDVTAANTVFSYNVASAEIQIVDKGLLRENQRPGWFKRIWDFVSPF